METTARRQFVRWSFFKIDPAWRALSAEERVRGKLAFEAVAKQWASKMVLRAYTLVGLRGDADIGLWLVTERLEDFQELHTQLFATPMGPYLSLVHSFLAMTKRSLYVDKYATEEEAKRRDIIVPGESKYLFVYPFVKTRAWYALSMEERQRMMDDHIRVGRKYPDVKLNTTYSYGLDDQEFVVAFETDNPSRFLDLVEELRFSEASQYTLRDTPLIPCVATTVRGMLNTIDGEANVEAEPVAVGAQHAAPVPAPVEAVAAPEPAKEGDFVEVAKVGEVPAGSSKLVVVNGEQVALFNVNGTFYALSNRCSHARGPLVDGEVKDGKVACPWHAAEFDLQSGAALCKPARGPIPAYTVKVEGGAVLVGPQKTPATQQRELPERVDNQLDPIDKKLVNIMQFKFPVVSRPWQALGEEAGTTEADVMQRIARLRELDIVRQISPIFDTRKLGYKSSLVAARVDPERLEEAAAIVNSHPGVSHNYRRDHYFNMWFTIAVPPEQDLDTEVKRLTDRAGVDKVRMLPTLKMYKIAVKLNLEEDETKIGKETQQYIKATDVRPITERDKHLIRATQDDMPLVEEPFKLMAENAGITEEELFAWLNEMQQMNYLRRIAAILRHQKAGFTDNGMITWKVPEDKVDEAGRIAASYSTVSHCYRRPIYEDWPYNFFSMVHARSRDNAEEIGRQIAGELRPLGVTEYVILFSTKEFKKDRVRYFVDWNMEAAAASETVDSAG
jgi:chlorite dismutase/DNA-binding Lrp family transcriptional regulator/nitrite reductase/ring-hydroxylating ferredoxin subunit